MKNHHIFFAWKITIFEWKITKSPRAPNIAKKRSISVPISLGRVWGLPSPGFRWKFARELGLGSNLDMGPRLKFRLGRRLWLEVRLRFRLRYGFRLRLRLIDTDIGQFFWNFCTSKRFGDFSLKFGDFSFKNGDKSFKKNMVIFH